MTGELCGFEQTMSAVSEDELDRAIAQKNAEIKQSSEKTPDDERRRSSAKGHRGRVRTRFLQSGLTGFAPHEMLELLLFYAIPQRDTKQIAHELIDRFGSVAGVFDAEVSELVKVSCITENTAVLFKLIPQLLTVYYSEADRNVSYTNTTTLAHMFKPYFVGAGSEKFLLACFDGNLKLLGVNEISRGTSSYTSIEMRKIMSEALGSGCTMAALAHNHPGGNPKPSDEDVAVTRRISELLKAVDIQLMDHIIVGAGKTYSMRDGGDLTIFD